MRSALTRLVAVALLLALAAPATADWVPGMAAKFVQMPDPLGWDVNIVSPRIVADDFLCKQPGAIKDVHFWFSVRHDEIGSLEQLASLVKAVHVSIHADIPAGPDQPFSMPGKELWVRDFTTSQIQVNPAPQQGDQGWADPVEQLWVRPDHKMFFQVNITDIRDPFVQEGTPEKPIVYWLDLSILPVPGANPQIGWKTSLEHWNDDAVYGVHDPAGGGIVWHELIEPTGRSLDMAFVITPEPSTFVMLLGAALMAWMACARHRNR